MLYDPPSFYKQLEKYKSLKKGDIYLLKVNDKIIKVKITEIEEELINWQGMIEDTILRWIKFKRISSRTQEYRKYFLFKMYRTVYYLDDTELKYEYIAFKDRIV